MKKKIYGALVLGSLLLSGGLVSCSDYDDDINSLNGRVDGIEKTLADLKAKIEAGAVITAIEETDNGYVIKTSDGKDYPVKNGENGEDGTKITIDENGYWCADGTPIKDAEGQPIKAAGEKGDQGDPGTPGTDGKDGIWYEPGTDGYWYKVTPQEEGEPKKEKTTIRWQGETGSLTIVYDTENGKLIISGAEGMAEGETMVINTTSDLKSLALIPYTIDSKTGMPLIGFYNVVAKDGSIAESTDATAHFRLNPANANVNEWKWSMIDRTAQVRATGDNVNDLLAIKGTPESAKGEMTVTLKSKKSLDGLNPDEIAIFALSGSNEKTGEQIVSDYGKVISKDLKKFAIVNASLGGDFAFQNEYPVVVPQIGDLADAKFAYTESIDLNTLVWTWAKDLNQGVIPGVTLEGLNIDGLTYTFEKPAEYIGTDGVTNQQKFVDLDPETGIVKVNSYGTAAVGRTPIFLAKALVNGKEVASGYIKLEITNTIPVEKTVTLTVECGDVDYQKLDNILVEDTPVNGLDWEKVNEFYRDYQLTEESFRENYTLSPSDVHQENGVKINYDYLMSSVSQPTATYAVSIDMDPTTVEVVDLLGKERKSYIVLRPRTDVYPTLVIEFKYKVVDNVAFPEYNDSYLAGKDLIQVKGRAVNGVWTMISDINEHFADYLAHYVYPKNHDSFFTAVLPTIDGVAQRGAAISSGTTTATATQNIKLTTPLSVTESARDYTVHLNLNLANGETLSKEYVVRFATPYTVTVNDLTIKTLATATTADLKKAVKIVGPDGQVIYEKGAVVSGADKYLPGYSINYALTGSESDSWESFGGKLTVNASGIITWDNGGTELQKDKIATPVVTLVVPTVASVKNQPAKITVLSSDHSKE